MPLTELEECVRIMLGELYRPSPEYEACDLPVWPDNITAQPERKAGEFLKGMEKNPGTRKLPAKSGGNIVLPPTLKDLGIEKMESQRWQKIEIVE